MIKALIQKHNLVKNCHLSASERVNIIKGAVLGVEMVVEKPEFLLSGCFLSFVMLFGRLTSHKNQFIVIEMLVYVRSAVSCHLLICSLESKCL